jgi:hypothetical protein
VREPSGIHPSGDAGGTSPYMARPSAMSVAIGPGPIAIIVVVKA